MNIFSLTAVAVAISLSAAPSIAAMVDLPALGLTKGALLAESDEAIVTYSAAFGSLEATVDDGTSLGAFSVFTDDLSSAFLSVGAPLVFAGSVVSFAFDATSAAGLFFDGTDYVYGVLTLPGGTAFDFGLDSFEIRGASVELHAVAPTTVIPLPLTAPLLLAGLGALAVAARRRG